MLNVNKQKFKVALIGGGVSSVAAALTLPPLFDVVIFERDTKLLKKLMKTGNGKANIFNTTIDEHAYNHPAFIAQHPAMLSLVQSFYKESGILTFIDEEGRGYPFSRSARSLATYLIAQLGAHVTLKTSTPVREITSNHDGFYINGERFDDIMIATGSSCYDPHVDVANDNDGLLHALGLTLTEFYPTSGPIMINDNLRLIENEKVKAILTIKDRDRLVTTESGEILFKKDSLSGIASFIASSRLTWDHRDHHSATYTASLNIIDGHENALKDLLAKRPLDSHVFQGIVSDPLANYLASRMSKKVKREELMNLLTDLKFTISRDFTLPHEKGQLMSGGVDLSTINNHKFSLISNDNLYLAGEVLDIDGVSGGYNLMFAVYSGLVVAHDIINKRCQ